jgi:glycosyltransferase involved in cell wall biosynthesis
MGTQPHADLLAGLAAGRWDAVVVPSVRVGDVEEGIPVSLMEAMAAGVPVVSTRTGGIQELIDERTGLLVDGGDADGLAQALGRLERDHVLRHALAREGRARVERAFNVRSIAAALIDRFAESS